MKLLTTTLVALLSISVVARATPRHPRRPAHRATSIAQMNLTPRTDLARPIAAPDFAQDRLPTNMAFAPSSRLNATVGYKPLNRGQDLQSYEVNQAAATRFGSPDPSLGASVAVKF